jgi:hypothetical protein
MQDAVTLAHQRCSGRSGIVGDAADERRTNWKRGTAAVGELSTTMISFGS